MDLRPHGLDEASLDSYTRSMHKNISRSVQEGFRDGGHFKAISDHLVLLAAALMVPYYSRFLAMGRQQRSFRYGDTFEHSIHVIDLRPRSKAEAEAEVGGEARIVLFVHGGAWGSGKPWMYRLSAAGLAKCVDAEVVVLIQYKVFPHNHILEQRDDIMNAIDFIKSSNKWKPEWLQNADGDVRLILSGHSSGANISALAIFKAMEDGYRLVDDFIGLSGVFHLYKHYLWEKARGVHLISPMRGAAEQAGGFELCSPTRMLQSKYENAEGRNEDRRDGRNSLTSQRNLLPEIFILHGVDDRTVPVSSSLEFATELTLKGIQVEKAFLQGMDHATPVMELAAIDCEKTPTGMALARWREEVTVSSIHSPRARL